MADEDWRGQQREIRKRPRPVISCLQCRQKKLKCDRLLPCQQCIKGGRAETCAYAEGQQPELRQDADADTDTCNNASKRPRAAQSQPLATQSSTHRGVDEILKQLRELERALQEQQCAGSPNRDNSPSRGPTAQSLSLEQNHDRHQQAGECVPLSPYGTQPLLLQDLLSFQNDVEVENIAAATRAVQRFTKQPSHWQRGPYSEMTDVLRHMHQLFPNSLTCEKLIELYFENFEHCSRILHRPSFVVQYRQFCSGSSTGRTWNDFVPQLLGVLSAAVCLNTIAECNAHTLQRNQSGLDPVQLLENWLDLLNFRDCPTVSELQTHLLLLQLQKLQGHNTSKLVGSSGRAVRNAMLMGLHRSGLVTDPTFDNEIRRRLWVTILEQDFALAIACNTPATCPRLVGQVPLNIDDEDMMISATRRPASRPNEEWTDGLCQHVLAMSFNKRLEAYNIHFASHESAPYNSTMLYARELEQTILDLPRTFRLDHSNPPGRLLAQMELDITLRRPLIALYAPFATNMPHDDRFGEARVAWIQANLVILCFQDLFDPKYPVIDVPRPEGYWDLYYTIYAHDTIAGLQAILLELQRMKTPSHRTSINHSLGLQQHPHRTGSKVLGWTIAGMILTVEDTIDPFFRRVGQVGADFDDLIRYNLVFDSLRCEESGDAESTMRSGLKFLIDSILGKIQNAGRDCPIVLMPSDLEWMTQFLQHKDMDAKVGDDDDMVA